MSQYTDFSEVVKFNEWMAKIGSIHYCNHARMILAYERVLPLKYRDNG